MLMYDIIHSGNWVSSAATLYYLHNNSANLKSFQKQKFV